MQPYIYLITDTRNGKRNVGQSNGKDKRYFTGSTIVKSIVKKHGSKEAKEFLKKEIIVQGNFNQLLLDELERHYIRLYATRAPLGYNLTDGGDLKLGQTNYDGSRKVAQYSLTGELIKTWDSILQASRALSIDNAGITVNAKRKNKSSKTHGGFLWRYPEDVEINGVNIPNMEKLTLQIKKEISDKIKALWQTEEYRARMLNSHNTPESKAKRSKIHKGKKVPQEIIDKVRAARLRSNKPSPKKGKKVPQHIVEKSYKKVAQYSLDGELIKIWHRMTTAAEDLGVDISEISTCASGKNKTAKGFMWRLISRNETAPDKIDPYKNENRTQVAQHSLTGELIKIWNSIKEAAIEMKVGSNSISDCINGRSKTSKNFIWKRIDPK